MTTVNTQTIHNIDEIELKKTISKTASLIRYQGEEYLNKLQQLNSQYEIKNQRFLTERELIIKNY